MIFELDNFCDLGRDEFAKKVKIVTLGSGLKKSRDFFHEKSVLTVPSFKKYFVNCNMALRENAFLIKQLL